MPSYSPRFCALLLSTTVVFTASGQLQTNKPNSSTIPTVSNVHMGTGYTGSTPLNYVRTWTALKPFTTPGDITTATWTDARQTTGYADGLGRPLQTVIRQATAGLTPKDIITPVEYDDYGREQYKYMPYVANASDGILRINPFTEQKAYLETQYANPAEQIFYSKTNFEASPLNRVEKTMAPGNSWAGNNIGIEQKYLVNIANDEVVKWGITNNALTYSNNDVTTNIPTPVSSPNTYYLPGYLYKNVTLDETGNVVVEYKDKSGKLILKKVQSGSVATDYSGYPGFSSTYYIYDDLDNLRFVIPSKAVEAIRSNWSIAGNTDVINELCFRYEYDHRNRLIAKKAPGAGWTYMVYDTRDRLVFTQDANLRTKNQWLTTLYDVLNRPIITGITTWTGTPTVLQTMVTSQTATPIVPPGTPVDLTLPTGTLSTAYVASNSIVIQPETVGEPGFSASIISESAGTVNMEGVNINKSPIPAGASFIALTITYYDHYNWTSRSYTTSYNSQLSDVGTDASKKLNLYPDDLSTTASQQTNGLVTGTKIRILQDPNNVSAGGWKTGVVFYDNKARLIQTQADNHKQGQDILSYRYSFIGKIIGTYHVHNNPDAVIGTIRIKTVHKLDPGGRLTEIVKTVNDEAGKSTVVAFHEYNELGQLKKKEMGRQKDPGTGNYTSTPIETQDYTYNVRGWLQGINKEYLESQSSVDSRWFGMELNYNWGFQTNQLNGNIAGTKWRSRGDGERRSYGFSYDLLNRLMGADFAQYNGSNYVENGTINFDMTMGNGTSVSSAYDENGNIKAMKQWGLKLNSSVVIDDMQYSYHVNSNKLRAVTETGTGTTDHKLGDFTDKNTTSDDYGYDLNGNLIADLNKRLNGNTGIDQTSGGAIIYNHLNLPWKMGVKTDAGAEKGTITYIYDATGAKLQKITEDKSISGQTVITTTDYIGGMVYESKATTGGIPAGSENNYTAKLQFINHEEGRIRYIPGEGFTPASFVYDYFVKDHLGNVRMVLTDECKQDIYPAATLEGSLSIDGAPNAAFKEKDYYAINPAYVVPKSAATGITDYVNKNGGSAALDVPVNNNPNSQVTANSQQLYKLNATTNKTGLGITLKVMTGDQINIFGKSYWINTGGSFSEQNTLPVTGLLDAFLGSPSMTGKGLVTATLNTGAFASAVTPFLGRADNPGYPAPWAYINWIFLDEQFNYAGGNSSRVGQSGVVRTHDNTNIPTLTAPKNGYIFVYCSNESNYDVFFDNLQLIHNRGPILEETHYYPFGLTMAGISNKALGKQENNYKYNGIENETDLELNYYDAFFRELDPQIGRWIQIDPKTNYGETPYASMGNNPINSFDWLGDIITFGNASVEQAYKDLRADNDNRILKYLGELINSDFKTNDKRTRRLVNLINKHAEFNNQLDKMETSALEFKISADPPKDPNAAATTNYDWSSKSIHINLGNKYSDKENMAHELRHGYGFLIGEMAMSKTMAGLLTDMTDEVAGYQTGFLFTNRANEVADGKITVEWFKKLLDTYSRAKMAYITLLGKETSLTINTLAATLVNYLPTGDEKQIIQDNLNNTNLQAIDVMRAMNSKYSVGPGHPPYNLEYYKKE